MENISNSFSTLSINIIHPEYNLEIKISFESRTVNINIVLANPSLNYVSANLGTEMLCRSRRSRVKPVHNQRLKTRVRLKRNTKAAL